MKKTLSLYTAAILSFSFFSPLHAAQQLETKPPSTYELACISDYAYQDNIQQGMTIRNNEGNISYELSAWKVIKTFSVQKKKWGGYQGLLCYHTIKNQVVLAHRGTKLSNLDSLHTDLLAITLGFIEGQAGEIDPFINDTLDYTKEKNASLYITGHSLGGWLAQVTKFILQTKYKDNVTLQAIEKSNPIRCITFDTPGAAKALKHFGKTYANTAQAISQRHITNYLSAPNPVNSCSQHTGSCYRVIFDFPENELANLPAHSLAHFIQSFHASQHPYLHQIEKWPIIFPTNCLENFIKLFQNEQQNNTQSTPITKLWNATKSTGATLYKTFNELIKYTRTQDTMQYYSGDNDGMIYLSKPYTSNAPHHQSIPCLIEKTTTNADWRLAKKTGFAIYSYMNNSDYTLMAPSCINRALTPQNSPSLPVNNDPINPIISSIAHQPHPKGGGLKSLLSNATVVSAGLNALGKGFEMGSAIARVYEQKEMGKNMKIHGQETRKTMKQAHTQNMAMTTKKHKNQLEIIKFVTENKTTLLTHHNKEIRKTEQARFQHSYDLKEQTHQHSIDQISHKKEAQKEVIKYEYDHQMELIKIEYAQEAHRNDEDAVKNNLPPYVYETSIKREAPLSQLQNYFCPQKESQAKRHTTRYLTLYGWIGSGKTNLALRYAHDHFKAPYTMVWWINANTEQTIEESLKKMVRLFGDKQAHKESSITSTQHKLHVKTSKASNKANKRWLIVWDNINLDTYKIFKHYDNANIYPSTGGDIILTTRNPSFARGKTIFLDSFSTEEATKLFTRYRKPINTQNKKALLQLIKNYHALPIAIAEAGQFIKEANNSFEEYIDTPHLQTNTVPSSHEQTLQQAFKQSVEQLPPHVQKLLHIVSYYDFTALPAILIKHIIKDRAQRNIAIIRCKKIGLLYTMPCRDDLLFFHPLYQHFLRYQHQIDKNNTHIKKAGNILVTLWKKNPNKLHHHLHAYWDHWKKASQQSIQDRKEEEKEAEEDDEMAFLNDADEEEQKTQEKPDLPPLVDPKLNEKMVAVLLPKMPQVIYHYLSSSSIAYEKALDLLLSTLSVAEACKKASPQCLQQLYSYLGDTLLGLNRIKEAKKAYQQALTYDDTQAILYDNLARCYLTTKQIDLAAQAYQNALHLQQKQNTYHSSTAATIYFTLAQHYEGEKFNKKAINLYEKTLKEKEANPSIIQQSNLSLALLYEGQAKFDKVTTHYKVCLKASKVPLVITANLGLGLLNKNKGANAYPLAIDYLNTAWHQATNYWGKQAPTTLRIWNSLLDTYLCLYKNKNAALKSAARFGQLEVVKELLPHVSSQWGKDNALWISAENGNLEIVKYLRPHASRDGKDEALWISAESGKLELVKELLPHTTQKGIDKALWISAYNGQLEVVKYLHPHVNDQEAKDKSLKLAVANGYLEMVKELLPHVNDQEAKDKSLKLAVANGYLEMVKELLPHVNDQKPKNESLISAAWSGRPEVVEVLKELLPHASQRAKDKALLIALKYGHLEIVKDLVPHTSKEINNPLLKVYAKDGHLDEVKELLPHASKDAKDKALIQAKRRGHLEIVKVLENAGAKMPE